MAPLLRRAERGRVGPAHGTATVMRRARTNGGTLVGMPAPAAAPAARVTRTATATAMAARSWSKSSPARHRACRASLPRPLAPRSTSRPGTNTRSASPRWCRATACAATASRISTRSALYKPDQSELSLERFGLAEVDPDTVFATGNFAGAGQLPLREIVRRLRETYTRTIGVEFRNIEEPEIRSWIQEQMEPTCNRISLTPGQQVRILSKLIDAEIFEQFLHTKYVGAKRFSLEGAESLIPLMELVIERPATAARRDGHRHGAPRAPERDGQRDGEEPQGDLLRLRGQQPGAVARQGRREVPPRLPVGPAHAGGQHDAPHARVQPEPPRVRRPGRRRPRARQAGPARRPRPQKVLPL